MMPSLVGRRLPDVALPATDRSWENLAKIESRSVLFFYPYTGQPGIPDPPGWDAIPGAHGSTPQALSFSRLYPVFQTLGVKVFGVSMQSTAWQSEFVTRNLLAFPLLSDEKRQVSDALGLPVFKAGQHEYLCRRTLLSFQGMITHDLNNIPNPAENADEILKIISP
jgi:peroxiredoxin